jgi:tRNA1(Val) A37 N6-methylase TrmN6
LIDVEKSAALLPEERIDDLLTHGLGIIQSKEVFSFSLDAVLLARFCSVPHRGQIVDLCTGNGVIPLLLSTKTKAPMIGVEIQDRLADMAARSVSLNKLDDQINIVCGDLREAERFIRAPEAELVTVNPPYLPVPAGEQNTNPHVAAARHEIHCTLEDVIATAAKLLKNGGKFAMVHRSARLVDIVTTMRAYGIEAKRIRYVHTRATEPSVMVLIEGIRGGKPEIRTLPPLIVYDEDNKYCNELMEVFYGKRDTL